MNNKTSYCADMIINDADKRYVVYDWIAATFAYAVTRLPLDPKSPSIYEFDDFHDFVSHWLTEAQWSNFASGYNDAPPQRGSDGVYLEAWQAGQLAREIAGSLRGHS